MKLLIVFAAALAFLALTFIGNPPTSKAYTIARPAAVLDSKVQPKQVTLDKDSKSDKWGDVAFNHETHTLKNYSRDGKSVIACVECHHTDQPTPPAPYKLAERKAALTTANLNDEGPVKSCRTCHFQEDTKPSPKLTYPGDSDPTELTNKEAYHRNCNVCHDAYKEKFPDTKAPTSSQCAACHVKKG
ncbi:MAG: cytochrome c3 family protein [Pyrinomonadaceae bacterium]